MQEGIVVDDQYQDQTQTAVPWEALLCCHDSAWVPHVATEVPFHELPVPYSSMKRYSMYQIEFSQKEDKLTLDPISVFPRKNSFES